jgi:hypothetical protein
MLDNVIEQLTVIPAPKGQIGKIRLSYRELNVEQLGSIYEGLLEQTPAVARSRLWRCELDSRMIVIDDADRERIRGIRGEKLTVDGLSLADVTDEEELAPEDFTDEEADSDSEGDANDEDADTDDAEEQPKRKQSAKKPLRILGEIPQHTVYLRGSQARKQSGSYYTSRAFVEFLVREALEPMAEGKSAQEIIALKVLDPAMGSAHFLVGATRRLAVHLLAAYRREVTRLRSENPGEEVSEDDLLVLANIPDELMQVWGSADEERELAVCRLIVAGNCIYGVDKNPLAVDLAKVSLWLVTAASQFPLSFVDHRLRCGDSLLGIPAAEVVRPWVRPPSRTKAKPKAIQPVELMISPKGQDDVFEFGAPSHKALCASFARALVCLRDLNRDVGQQPTNFTLHQARYAALQGTLKPWWETHQLRVGLAFSRSEVHPDLLNDWLRDLTDTGSVTGSHRSAAEPHRLRGERAGAFCWELAYPEVFFDAAGERRPDAGFSCVLGNPPWDKIKPERDGFYLAYEPLIRQYQGTAKNRRIASLHAENPAIASAWEAYEFQCNALSGALLDGGIYCHQTAIIEEQTEDDDGDVVVKKKTTGGDPDCYKFFLERAWQLTAAGQTFGMVMSSSLHNGQGATGVRRLMLDRCRLRILVKFDNELRVFPGVHNQFKFDIVVVEKAGSTATIDAAFFSRQTETSLQQFRTHSAYLRIPAAEIRKLSPQMLTLFEFGGQPDVDLVQKACSLHPPFGDGLMSTLRLTFRREFDMGNSSFLFRSREWLRNHGCTPESGEQWRAADAEWYGSRAYIERPLVQWYVLFQGTKVISHRIPWAVTSSKAIKEKELDDFTVRIDMNDDIRFFGKPFDDGGHPSVYIPHEETRSSDLPAYIPAAKTLLLFTFGPAIRPRDLFVPFVEGKQIHQFDYKGISYVSGEGSWVVSRPCSSGEYDSIPHYFMAAIDTVGRVALSPEKIGFRSSAKSSDERSSIACAVPGNLPAGDNCPTLFPQASTPTPIHGVVAYLNSLVVDSFLRLLVSGKVGLHLIAQLPIPIVDPSFEELNSLASKLFSGSSLPPAKVASIRACLDAFVAAAYRLTVHEFARLLAGFPLLDRDQPPLPHDYRIRLTKKGMDWRKNSFVTRDLALLTYFDFLAGELEFRPDREVVAAIYPHGVPSVPVDIVEFFLEAGIDIAGVSDHAVASTGPHRNLRDRVAMARELGAVAYVPTIDRRRATFVEKAAAAGGLSPDEGVLTPEMAQHVLRDKAAREAKLARAMELWNATPDPRAKVDPNRNLPTELQ